MIKFKLEGKSYSMPTSWKEVTVKQFFQFKEWQKTNGDFVKLLSILTGCDYDTMRKTKQLDVDDKLIPFMKWLEEPLTEKNAPKCSTLSFQGKQYEVPKDLGMYSLEQKIELKNRMLECITKTGDTIDCIKIATAIYMQPIIQDKEYSAKEAEIIAEQFDDCKIVELYAVGGFFLKKLIGSIVKNNPILLASKVRNKKLRELLTWIYSKRSTQLTHFRAVTS